MGILKSLYREIRGIETDSTHSYPFRRDILEETTHQILIHTRGFKPIHIIGHRLGDYKKYPKDANSPQLISGYSSTTELMEKAFSETGLDGIELDVRGDSTGEIYVTHDELVEPLQEKSKEYLNKNTFSNFLEYFIKNKYYYKKKIYIEIKQKIPIFSLKKFNFVPDSMEHVNTDFLSSLIETIDRCISVEEDKAVICSAINFISFHLSPLAYLHALAPDRHGCFYIITTNKSPEKYLAPLARHRALFPGECKRIRDADFLNGIWFDPFYLDNPARTLESLNEGREQRLEFYLSTYGMPLASLLEKLRKDPEKLELHGLIYELG